MECNHTLRRGRNLRKPFLAEVRRVSLACSNLMRRHCRRLNGIPASNARTWVIRPFWRGAPRRRKRGLG